MPQIEISPNLLIRLTCLENEISKLKRYLRIKITEKGKTKKSTLLKGLLKGIKIEEKDIEEAKKALFKNNYQEM